MVLGGNAESLPCTDTSGLRLLCELDSVNEAWTSRMSSPVQSEKSRLSIKPHALVHKQPE